MTTILSKHLTCMHHVYVHENACTPKDQFILELLLISINFSRNDSGPNRITQKIGRNDPPTKAETTHPQNWPKRPRPKRLRPKRPRAETTRIHVLHRKDVTKIKFFDESGFAHPDVSNPRYGRALKGERAIEIMDNRRTPNKTLNLLLGVEGVCYANILPGPSNTDTYIQFFFDAANATTNNGDLALKPGDFVIVDNCPIHHGRAERILSVFLDRLGIEYIFTPVYTPDLNPVELCFQHIKTLFKTEHVRQLAKDNLEYAIMYCVNTISPADCMGYFNHVGYLRT